MTLQTLYLLGEINFKGVERESGLFDHVAADTCAADVVFANLECCFYDLPEDASERRGFYVPPKLGKLLQEAGVHAVGKANNVNIGREAILSSIATLKQLGVAHVGAGHDAASARRALIIERDGVRYGFIQRTAVYWPDNHEAGPRSPGVAVIRADTAYRPRLELQSARTRPGVPPEVLTWAEPQALEQYRQDVAALRKEADVVIASFHWGFRREILSYQREYAYAAIEEGCDVVYGHGPHIILPIETYMGKPIFYGMGNYSFQMAHTSDDVYLKWIGMTARITVENGTPGDILLQFVQRSPNNETLPCLGSDGADERELLIASSRELGTEFVDNGDGLLLRRPHGGPSL